ncbi:hypothetical protein SAMD00023353_10100280 [Rosellinia necatrix]|uniref:Uncharacterized protein n=1 Tax=Rosellinia necatrix TaxID=77044 RepID=A0A1W2TUI0_ROSNE|nr:hypothetical protein SAMD00023353_10100280 [Rosellinia necatrix]
MKLIAIASSLLVAATATTVPAQCPIVWDDPRDVYGNPGYHSLDPYFAGTGKIHLRAGCTYWRQNYPRDIPDEPVWCMNEDGLVVPIADDDCATFNFIPATGELEDYPVTVLRTAKNNWICGFDFLQPNGEFGDDGRWACKELDDDWYGDLIDTWDGDAPHYLSEYAGGVISTTIFTWWMQHPPESTDDAQTLQWRIPDNPYSNYTLKPGDGTFPVLMEFVLES